MSEELCMKRLRGVAYHLNEVGFYSDAAAITEVVKELESRPTPAVDVEKVMALVKEYGQAVSVADDNMNHGYSGSQGIYDEQVDTLLTQIRNLLMGDGGIAKQEARDGR